MSFLTYETSLGYSVEVIKLLDCSAALRGVTTSYQHLTTSYSLELCRGWSEESVRDSSRLSWRWLEWDQFINLSLLLSYNYRRLIQSTQTVHQLLSIKWILLQITWSEGKRRLQGLSHLTVLTVVCCNNCQFSAEQSKVGLTFLYNSLLQWDSGSDNYKSSVFTWLKWDNLFWVPGGGEVGLEKLNLFPPFGNVIGSYIHCIC